MNKLQLKFAALAILFASNSLFAQKKSLPGYHVSQQGDTIRGVFPKYRQWNKNPSKVDFVVDGTLKQTQLTPENVRGFVVEGYDEYLSYIGNRLMNPIEDGTLLSGNSFPTSDDSIQQANTFLRLVQKTTGGNLYILNDTKRINFFYQLPNQPVTELRYKKTLIQGQINALAEYRQQLISLFAAEILDRNLTSRLERLTYDEGELSSFFQALFPSAVPDHMKPKRRTEWDISAGGVLNMVTVESVKSSGSVSKKYSSSFSPLLSLGFMVPIGRNFEKYFFYPQVKMFRYKSHGEDNQGTIRTSITYKSDLVVATQLGGGLNVVNKERYRLFFTGSFGMMWQFGAKQIKQIYTSPDGPPHPDSKETKLPSVFYSIDGSACAELNKKMLLSFTYLIPTKISNFVSYSPKLSGIQLRVGYKL